MAAQRNEATRAHAGTVAHAVPVRKERAPFGGAGGRVAAAGAAAALAMVLLAAWTRTPHIGWCLAGLIASGGANWLAQRTEGRVRRRWTIAAVLLVVAAAGALATQYRLHRVGSDWSDIVASRSESLSEDLSATMTGVVANVRQAARLGDVAAESSDGATLFQRLDAVRRRTGIQALAVLDSTGDLLAWSGEHRGRLPERLRARAMPPGGFYFAQRPLFSYLYAIEPEGRMGANRRVVAATLLESTIAAGQVDLGGVANRFEERTGARPRFAPGAVVGATWQLEADRMPIMHATFGAPAQSEYRQRVANGGRRLVGALLLVALLLLWAAWVPEAPSRRAGWAAPLPLLLGLLLIVPLGPMLGLDAPFSPAMFLLAAPAALTLGQLAALLAPLVAMVIAARTGSRASSRGRAVVRVGLGVLLLFPLLLAFLRDAMAGPLYQNASVFWLLFQPVVVLTLVLALLLLLPYVRSTTLRRRSDAPEDAADADEAADDEGALHGAALAASLVLAALFGLALGYTSFGRAAATNHAGWVAAAWALPAALLAAGVSEYRGPACRLLRAACAGWVAATLVLPVLDHAQAEQRLAAVEREVGALGTRADPYLEFLLRRFGEEITRRDLAGEGGVALVYRAWAASGLASQAYVARITVWGPDGTAEVELTPGVSGGETPRLLAPPDYLQRAIRETRGADHAVYSVADEPPDVQEAAVIPMAGGRVATVVVPMRRTLSRATVLEPLLGERHPSDARLTMVPGHSARFAGPAGSVVWYRTQEGWRGETDLVFPEGTYHAHVELRRAPPGVRFARAVLLAALDLLLLTLLWTLGRLVRADPPRPREGWRAWIGSYRARVTGALFLFFLIPTIVFGAVAYRALAGEVVRAARLVAERSIRRAIESFDADARGDLTMLANLVGTDVLYYHRGELLQASTPEAIDLGLYSAWMPEWVYRSLRDGEELELVDEGRLGRRSYLVAYRALPAAGMLGVPVWPATGVASDRQSELAHLILFAALLGGLLSFTLSVAVGRALAGPIGRLRRAATAVGAGNLRVRLPEHRADEFGQLYRSFNRMIQRLRQARAQEVRTARVLAWGEMARQVAHEIKNPLTPIKLAVQHVRRAYRDGRPDFDEILESNVDQMLAEIDRLSEISRVFARYGAPIEAAGPLEPMRLRPLVQDVVRLYATGESAVDFGSEIDAALPPVMIRADEMKEVLINLLENAREALPGGGRVRIRGHAEADVVVIEVSDDGVGIPPELLPRIFEPRFSSRTAGTGLGLAIVRRLVEGWGGTIEVESAPGRGTTVRIAVPRAGGASLSAAGS